jgi:predicted small metal-binding protein
MQSEDGLRLGCVFPGWKERFRERLVEVTMLIRYSCKDMGLNCSFYVKGQTMEEVTRQAIEHIKEKHKEDFNSLLSTAQIEDMHKALSRSTRVVEG